MPRRKKEPIDEEPLREPAYYLAKLKEAQIEINKSLEDLEKMISEGIEHEDQECS